MIIFHDKMKSNDKDYQFHQLETVVDVMVSLFVIGALATYVGVTTYVMKNIEKAQKA
ncbi:hypothetical protein [Priestia aryabhattai]|uniref:hypothetical protein n=1 Tax=Priestia aryabhattai TaxID=412384 RepID=UPI001C8DB9DE|nr:hypothetical protein [Priestia aryabhattai]MBY0007601.1 hypothetical protein [Priestia aryabhattai]MBY0045126.1 hypothetical protein [Priestia aryabhattai]